MGLRSHCKYSAFRSGRQVDTNFDTTRLRGQDSWILYSDHPAISTFNIINELREKAGKKRPKLRPLSLSPPFQKWKGTMPAWAAGWKLNFSNTP